MKFHIFTQKTFSSKTWLLGLVLLLSAVTTISAQIPGGVRLRVEKLNATDCDTANGRLFISTTALPTMQPPGLPVGKILFKLTVQKEQNGPSAPGARVPIPVKSTLDAPTAPLTAADLIAANIACGAATIAGASLPVVSGEPLDVSQPNYYLDPVETATSVAAYLTGATPPPFALPRIPNPCMFNNVVNMPGSTENALDQEMDELGLALKGHTITGLAPGHYTITAASYYAGAIGAAGGIIPLASETITVEIGITPPANSCIGGTPTSPGLHISAHPECKTKLRASQILQNQCATEIIDSAYSIRIYTLGNTLVAKNDTGVIGEFNHFGGSYVPNSLIGKVFKVEVVRKWDGSKCWGYVKLEDKSAPIITCPGNVTLACSAATWKNGVAGTELINSLGQVGELSGPASTSQSTNTVTGVVNSITPTLHGTLAQDGLVIECSKWTQFYTDVVTGSQCAGWRIERTWWGKDEWGNTSDKCIQIITVNPPVEPVITNRNPTIECTKVTSSVQVAILNNVEAAALGLQPKVEGGLQCGFDIIFKNAMIVNGSCGGSYKIMRNYQLVRMCPTMTVEDLVQVITVTNTALPSLKADYTDYKRDTIGKYCWLMNGTMKMVSDGYKTVVENISKPLNGTATVIYPLVSSTACNTANIRMVLSGVDNGCVPGVITWTVNDSRLEIVTVNGQTILKNKLGAPFMRSDINNDGILNYLDDPSFVLKGTTACGLSNSQTFVVSLEDNMTPNTVCKTYVTATLDENGFVRIPKAAFENGSSDNCDIERQMVRRMTVATGDACSSRNQSPIASTECWNDFVDFTCDDVQDGSIMVALRSVDAAGNHSDCMVNVEVFDKTKPTCTDQPTISLKCNAADLNGYKSLYTQPAAFDNCGVTLKGTSDEDLVVTCGKGSAKRTWTFADCAGNTVSCIQKIDVTPVSGFRVKPLLDSVFTCSGFVYNEETEKAKALSLVRVLNRDSVVSCSAPIVEVEKWEYSNTQFCKIIRIRYTFVDKCLTYCTPSLNEYGYQNFEQNGSYGIYTKYADGYFQAAPCANGKDGLVYGYERFIMINDRTAPTSVPPTIADVCFGDGCTGTFAGYTLTGTDVCTDIAGNTSTTGSGLKFSWTLNGPNTSKSGITASIPSMVLGGGTYTVNYTVEDLCGNRNFYSFSFIVRDCKTPWILVHEKNLELGYDTGTQTGMGTVCTGDVINNLGDNCTGFDYLNQKARLQFASSAAVYSETLLPCLQFSCADKGKTIPVRVWTRDEAGNTNFVLTYVTVQDNRNACSPQIPLATINGTLKTENGQAVKDVVVSTSLNGTVAGTNNTDAAGSYSFTAGVLDQNVTVKAVKIATEDKYAGVTTFDIARISKHLLDIEKFTSPYSMIAADVNKDGEIDATDMLQIRNFILKKSTNLPGGVWRFIDKSYKFTNAANPFGEDFPEVVNLSKVPATATANFVAVKLGDVNTTYVANLTGVQVRNSNALVLQAQDMQLVAGNEYTVDITADNFNAIAFQGTISMNGATVKSVKAGDLANYNDGNFGVFANDVTTSWNGASKLNANVMSITFVANKNAKLSEVMTVGSGMTPAVANDAQGNEMNVNLKFTTGKVSGGEFALYQNTPNPVALETTIGFNLPKDEQARLTVYTVDGKTILAKQIDGKAGANQVTINKSELNANGVMYYRLETAEHTATKKMVIIE